MIIIKKRSKQTLVYRLTACVVLLIINLWTTNLWADSALGRWQSIGYSVSGLAKVIPSRDGAAYSFLGVIDNKHDDEPRTVLINLDGEFNIINLDNGRVPIVTWPGGYPSEMDDLESIAAIPNGYAAADQQFVATTSDGYFWRFTLNANEQIVNVVQGSERLSQAGSTGSAEEIESIAFFTDNNSSIKLVWSGRGSRDHSARMFVADLTSTSSSISYSNDNEFQIQETHFNWPRPVWSGDDDTRLISDLKVGTRPVNGAIYVSSAFDGGDTGPFAATLYNPGTLLSRTSLNQKPSPYKPYSALFIGNNGKKVEALELLTGDPADGFILGTDDEDLGGFIMIIRP